MSFDPISSTEPSTDPTHNPHRLFLREPGWRIAVKSGSAREFCYMVAPGQDFYHRLLDLELYLYHGDERLCLSCAERRGLLSLEPKPLRESIVPVATELQNLSEYEVEIPDMS
jgi:hypothetical protein